MTQESNPGPRARTPSALTTKPLSHRVHHTFIYSLLRTPAVTLSKQRSFSVYTYADAILNISTFCSTMQVDGKKRHSNFTEKTTATFQRVPNTFDVVHGYRATKLACNQSRTGEHFFYIKLFPLILKFEHMKWLTQNKAQTICQIFWKMFLCVTTAK